ncbi:MAG: hypothetical protein ABJD07_14515, partial [Gemmatimonadaceae bacterium]
RTSIPALPLGNGVNCFTFSWWTSEQVTKVIELECKAVIDGVFEYIEHGLDDVVMARYAAHFAVCVRCATYLKHGQQLLLCIGTRARMETAPASLRRRVLDALIELDAHTTDS